MSGGRTSKLNQILRNSPQAGALCSDLISSGNYMDKTQFPSPS